MTGIMKRSTAMAAAGTCSWPGHVDLVVVEGVFIQVGDDHDIASLSLDPAVQDDLARPSY